MKKILNLITVMAVMSLLSSCDEEFNPARFSKPVLDPVIESISETSFSWACDQLEAKTLVLTGKDLNSENVLVASDVSTSAFNINCNGNLIHFSPKSPNVDPENAKHETITISVADAEPFTVALTQSRMDKPMLLSLTPTDLKWNYDEVDEKTIAVEALNLEGVEITFTSDKASSDFTYIYENGTIKVSPKSVNENTNAHRVEVITMSLAGGNSMSFTVKQIRAPKPEGVLYESDFDVAGTATINVYNKNMTAYQIDGVEWKMCWACFTAQYKLSGKNSHILASVRTNTAGPSVVESGNLVDSSKEYKITSFALKLARRNANNGWCTVEYSVDGETWKSAGEDFQATQSSGSVTEYTFAIDEEDTNIFRVRLQFHFNGVVQTSHAFLNFDGITVMGY